MPAMVMRKLWATMNKRADNPHDPSPEQHRRDLPLPGRKLKEAEDREAAEACLTKQLIIGNEQLA